MHHCLSIPEVLTLIFKSVGYQGQNSQICRTTLAALARTCHVFSSPALDILWHELPSLGPLLKIIPLVRRP